MVSQPRVRDGVALCPCARCREEHPWLLHVRTTSGWVDRGGGVAVGVWGVRQVTRRAAGGCSLVHATCRLVQRGSFENAATAGPPLCLRMENGLPR